MKHATAVESDLLKPPEHLFCAVAGCMEVWEYELMLRHAGTVFALRVCFDHVLTFADDGEGQ